MEKMNDNTKPMAYEDFLAFAEEHTIKEVTEHLTPFCTAIEKHIRAVEISNPDTSGFGKYVRHFSKEESLPIEGMSLDCAVEMISCVENDIKRREPLAFDFVFDVNDLSSMRETSFACVLKYKVCVIEDESQCDARGAFKARDIAWIVKNHKDCKKLYMLYDEMLTEFNKI